MMGPVISENKKRMQEDGRKNRDQYLSREQSKREMEGKKKDGIGVLAGLDPKLLCQTVTLVLY